MTQEACAVIKAELCQDRNKIVENAQTLKNRTPVLLLFYIYNFVHMII